MEVAPHRAVAAHGRASYTGRPRAPASARRASRSYLDRGTPVAKRESNAVVPTQPKGNAMKQFFAVVLISLLAASPVFAQVDNHAKAKKGAILGGALGALAGAV